MSTDSQYETAVQSAEDATLLVLNEQICAAASRIKLLAEMRLTRTSGYREAVETYEAKVKACDDLKARLQGT